MQGVRFETVAIDASDEFLEMYDGAVEVWQATRDLMRQRNLDKGQLGTVSVKKG